MFFYRASAETSLKRWGSILDENFQLVLPITPYRSFPPAEVRVILSEGKIKQYWCLICSKLWICLQLSFLISSYHHKRLQLIISYDEDHTKYFNCCFLLHLHFQIFHPLLVQQCVLTLLFPYLFFLFIFIFPGYGRTRSRRQMDWRKNLWMRCSLREKTFWTSR